MNNSAKSDTQGTINGRNKTVGVFNIGTINGRNKTVGVFNIQTFKIMGFGGLNYPSKGLARQLKIMQNKLRK